MDAALKASICDGCHRVLGRRMNFVVKSAGRDTLRCLRCALRYVPMLRRSLAIALVVGAIQVAINQGDLILGGHASPVLFWKIPLTCMVPFMVATVGALTNARREWGGASADRPEL